MRTRSEVRYDTGINTPISDVAAPRGGQTVAPQSAAMQGPSGGYLIGPTADAFFLGPGATILIASGLLTLRALGPKMEATADLLALWLTWLFIGPHYAATYRRAYTSLAILRAHPWVTLAAPPLLFAGAVIAVRSPHGFGLVYFAGYVIGSGYHYSGQSLGLALLYPLRQGAPLTPTEKRLIAAPLYLSWILTLLALFGVAQPGRNAAFGLVRAAYDGPPVPPWLLLVGLAILAVSFAGPAMVATQRRRHGIPLPWPTYAVLSAQTLWFTLGLYEPFFSMMLVPAFHAIQYVAFTGWHACRGSGRPRWRRVTLFVVPTVLLGLAIYPGSFDFFARGLPYADMYFMTAAVAAFLNLHHFLLDGRIWRMRERAVVETMLA